MPSYSDTSLKKLATCHDDIILICNTVINIMDVSIREGNRTLEKQQEYFNKGYSKCDGINKRSYHQYTPSMAVDIVPYPTLYNNDNREFQRLAKIMFNVSQDLFPSHDLYQPMW